MAAAGYVPNEQTGEFPAKRAAVIAFDNERTLREEGLDKTVADSFPASDPPSSIPNPRGDTA